MQKAIIKGLLLAIAFVAVACIPIIAIGAMIQSFLGKIVAGFIVFSGLAIVALFGFLLPISDQKEEQKEEEKRQRMAEIAEQERRHAEQERRRAEQIRHIKAQRARTLAEAEKAVYDAQFSAVQLPLILAEAELALDRAENELAEELPSPFWEAIEDAALRLKDFDNQLHSIENNRIKHLRLAESLNGKAPEFTLGISLLPDTKNTNQRINILFRRAQKMRDFPIIYEQRRTNTILLEGFRSLGNAIVSLGVQLQSELIALGDKLDCRLSNLESALQDSADQLAEQHREQLEIAETIRNEYRDSNAGITQIARDRIIQAERHAKQSREYEKTALRMFDNIQRRRRPFPPQFGDGQF